jgi:hypothetical protein
MHKLFYTIFVIFNLTCSWAQAQDSLLNATTIAEQNSSSLPLEIEEDGKNVSYWSQINDVWPSLQSILPPALTIGGLGAVLKTYLSKKAIVPEEVLEGELPESKYPDLKKLPSRFQKFLEQSFAHGFSAENQLPGGKTEVLWAPRFEFFTKTGSQATPITLPRTTSISTLSPALQSLYGATVSYVDQFLKNSSQQLNKTLAPTDNSLRRRENFTNLAYSILEKNRELGFPLSEQELKDHIARVAFYVLEPVEQAHRKFNNIGQYTAKLLDQYNRGWDIPTLFCYISQLFQLIPIPSEIPKKSWVYIHLWRLLPLANIPLAEEIPQDSPIYLLLEQLQPLVSQFITTQADALHAKIKRGQRACMLASIVDSLADYVRPNNCIGFFGRFVDIEDDFSREPDMTKKLKKLTKNYKILESEAITTINNLFKELYESELFDQEEIEFLGYEFNQFIKLIVFVLDLNVQFKNAESSGTDEDALEALKAELSKKFEQLKPTTTEWSKQQQDLLPHIDPELRKEAKIIRKIYKKFYATPCDQN